MFQVLKQTWALMLGMLLLMLGNGLQGTLLGVRGSLENIDSSTMGYIMAGYFLCMHFGICCGGWGKANTMNGGTRTLEFPLGGAGGRSILPREILANSHAEIVCSLCRLLYDFGYFFTIENPYGSHLWIAPVMVALMEYIGSNGVLVQFDQCTYGLQLPGATKFCFCRKRTCIFTNNLKLENIASTCPGISRFHIHDHAWGTVRIEGKTYSKAAAAGRYSNSLCRIIAYYNAEAISERFWGSATPWGRAADRRD